MIAMTSKKTDSLADHVRLAFNILSWALSPSGPDAIAAWPF